MTHRGRFPRETIFDVLRHVVRVVEPHVDGYAFVGSFRRQLETCGDADLLVVPRSPADVFLLGAVLHRAGGKTFVGGSDFVYIQLDNTPVNVFVTTPECWGSALQYTTGSREHNIAVRSYAKMRGLTANQYGVFHGASSEKIPGSSETESGFYAALGLRWVRPENRRKSSAGNGIIPLKLSPFDRAAAVADSANRSQRRPARRSSKEVRW